MYVSYFVIHLSVDGHLCSIHNMALVNNVSMNMGVQVSLLCADSESFVCLHRNCVYLCQVVVFLVVFLGGGTSY